MTRRSETTTRINADKTEFESDICQRRLSPTKVVVSALNRNGFEILKVSTRLESDLLTDVILSGFTLPWYVYELGLSAQSHMARSVKKFYRFVESNFDLVTNSTDVVPGKHVRAELSNTCFKLWLDNLKENETPYGVWNCTNDLLKLFRRSLNARYGKTSLWPKSILSAWKMLRDNAPAKPSHQKFPPLGLHLGIQEDKYTNRELLMGLRYGSMWILKKLAESRQKFTKNDEISRMLFELKGRDVKEYKRWFSKNCHALRGRKDKLDRDVRLNILTSESWNIIRKDPLLAEWQFHSFSKIRRDLKGLNIDCTLESSVKHLLLERCVNPDGSLRNNAKGFGRNDATWAPLREYFGHSARLLRTPSPCFWGLDWIIHTPLEKLLMVWILASERAQKSGIQGLTFEGLTFSNNKRSLQISTQKLRRLKSSLDLDAAEVHSMVYQRREPAYLIYADWLHQEEFAFSNIANYNVNKFFIPNSGGAVAGHISNGRTLSTEMLPLQLLATAGSTWQRTLFEETSVGARREAEAFIEILSNRVEVARQKGRSELTISSIGQSLIIEQQRVTNKLTKTARVESESVGHTFETGLNVYKDRLRELGIRELVEPVRAFSRKVGDEKILLALKMAEVLTKSTKKITLSEARQLSGTQTVGATEEQLLKVLDRQDILTISGELHISGEILIIQTEMTAAMMAGFMLHLETEISKLENTYREESSIRLMAKLIHLHQIFHNFPKHLQKSGRQLAAEMDFRFPPLR